MAKRVSAFPLVSSVDDADTVDIIKGGNNKRVTVATFLSGIIEQAELDTEAATRAAADATLSTTKQDAAEEVHLYATGGAGTVGSPWTSASGTGGLEEALTASATSGKPVRAKAGYYAVNNPVDNWFEGATLLTEGSRTIFVPAPAITGGLMFNITGSAGNLLDRVNLGGFHVARVLAGSVRVDYVSNSQIGRITCDGNNANGGGVLSVKHSERSQFGDVISWDMGTLGSAVYQEHNTDCQFGRIIQVGGQEALDVWNVTRCQFQQIISIDSASEGCDLGNIKNCQFGQIIVYNPVDGGVHVKVEDGEVTGGSNYNHFDSVTVLEAGLAGMYVNNGPTTPNGTSTCNHNIVSKLTITSVKAGALGYSSSCTNLNPTSIGNAVHNVSIKVPGKSIYVVRSVDFRAEAGHVESTGGLAVVIETASTRPSVRNLKIISAGSPAGPSAAGAINITDTIDPKVEFNEIISSNACGMAFVRMTGGSIANNIVTECGYDGIRYDSGSDAAYMGAVHNNFKHNRIRNVGRLLANRYAFRLTSTSGTTTAVHLDGNDCWQTSVPGTGSGNGVIWSGTWDYSSMMDNDLRDAGGTIVSGTPGTNSLVRSNLGHRTENNGTATITSAATTLNVSHGLGVTPAIEDISVTPTNNLGTATKFWISGPGGSGSPSSTLFSVNVDAVPGATTATFAWTASVQ